MISGICFVACLFQRRSTWAYRSVYVLRMNILGAHCNMSLWSTKRIYQKKNLWSSWSEWKKPQEKKIMNNVAMVLFLGWIVSDVECEVKKKNFTLIFDIHAHLHERDTFPPWSQVENIRNRKTFDSIQLYDFCC